MIKNKYICLSTTPLLHALQHEIINLIYIYIIYIDLLAGNNEELQ